MTASHAWLWTDQVNSNNFSMNSLAIFNVDDLYGFFWSWSCSGMCPSHTSPKNQAKCSATTSPKTQAKYTATSSPRGAQSLIRCSAEICNQSRNHYTMQNIKILKKRKREILHCKKTKQKGTDTEAPHCLTLVFWFIIYLLKSFPVVQLEKVVSNSSSPVAKWAARDYVESEWMGEEDMRKNVQVGREVRKI